MKKRRTKTRRPQHAHNQQGQNLPQESCTAWVEVGFTRTGNPLIGGRYTIYDMLCTR